jgi:hypothetical protein
MTSREAPTAQLHGAEFFDQQRCGFRTLTPLAAQTNPATPDSGSGGSTE